MKTLYGAHRPDEGTIIVNGAEQHFRSPARRDRGRASAWCSSTSCSPTTSRCGRTSSSATSRARRANLRRRIAHPPAPRPRQAVRARRRPRRARQRPRRRAEATRRDPEGALPRRPDHHPRRTDGGACAPRGRRAVRVAARAHRDGATAIFISHKLDEVLRFADAITVIRGRQDRRRGAGPSQVTRTQLAELMVGSELPDARNPREHGDDGCGAVSERPHRRRRGRSSSGTCSTTCRS